MTWTSSYTPIMMLLPTKSDINRLPPFISDRAPFQLLVVAHALKFVRI